MKQGLKKLAISVFDGFDRIADLVIAKANIESQKPYFKLLFSPLRPYYDEIKDQTDSSIKMTLIVSTFASIVMIFLVVFVIVVVNISLSVSNFTDMAQQRSDEVVKELKATSLGFQEKTYNFYDDSLQRKGSTLLDKDYLVIKPPFLENSFNTVRNFLLRTLELDDEILSTSFFVLEGQNVKAWIVADRRHPQGFGGLKITYDLTSKKWVSDVDGKNVKLADARIASIIKTKDKSIELIDYEFTDASGKTRKVKAYDCTIPVMEGRPEEISSFIAAGTTIGFLRYVITLEKMQSAVANEERLMKASVNRQESDAKLALQKAQSIGEWDKFRSLLILTILGCLVLIISVVITRKIAEKVVRPIIDLIQSAQTIAGGSYDGRDAKVDLSRKDEVGTLAQSFETMRESIHHKINDLNRLNRVGEVLSVQNVRMEVLDTALQAIAERFGFQTGAMLSTKTSEIASAWHIDRKYGGQTTVPDVDLGNPNSEYLAFIKQSGQPVFARVEGQNSLLYIPLMDGKDITGVMVFVGSDGIKFGKGDESFVETIARLTQARLNNLKMLEVIEQYNRTLEEKVKERTEQLRVKTNDITTMLQNIKQGVFTVYGSRVIHHEYSAYLETMLETSQIAGRDVVDVLFNGPNLGNDLRERISAALDAILNEHKMFFAVNAPHLPKSSELVVGGSTKLIEMDWNPIIDNDRVIKIIVTLRDVTELRKLREESQQHHVELEMIGEILGTKRKDFSKFMESSCEFIEHNSAVIQKGADLDSSDVETMLRNMHTIKGNARILGLRLVCDAAHQAEQSYVDLRTHSPSPEDSTRLATELGQVASIVEKYAGLSETKLGSVSEVHDGVVIDKQLFQTAFDAMRTVEIDKNHKCYHAMEQVKMVIESVGTATVGETLRSLIKSMPLLAKELNKDNPRINVIDNNIRLIESHQDLVRNVLTHTFRNTLDHGIETAAERLSVRKQPSGHIRIEFTKTNESITIVQEDDGRGLDLERIKAKGLEQGLIKAEQKPSIQEIANCILVAGVSTKECVSQISGRGVGLSAIQDYIVKAGGAVEIVLPKNIAADVKFVPFKLKMTLRLPAENSWSFGSGQKRVA